MKAADFFTLPASLAPFGEFFQADASPWAWVRNIQAAFAVERFAAKPKNLPAGVHVQGFVYIHPSVALPHTATLIGPLWLGEGTVVLPGAIVRGNVITGNGCTLAAGGLYENCVLMDRVESAHLTHVADSIIGTGVYLGVGATLASRRLEPRSARSRSADPVIEESLERIGAIVGEDAVVGSQAVLNPGSLLGRRSLVMPGVVFSGHLPSSAKAAGRGDLEITAR